MLKRVRQWAEGARSLFVCLETVAVCFHLWASVSHLSANKDSSLLSEVFGESSADSIRPRQ